MNEQAPKKSVPLRPGPDNASVTDNANFRDNAFTIERRSDPAPAIEAVGNRPTPRAKPKAGNNDDDDSNNNGI